MSQGKCGWCCGVELCEAAAREAAVKLNQVINGDVEKLGLSFPENYFDILLMSEVLEYLVDPWATLARLRSLMKPGALVRSGSPNVCHHSVLRALLAGRWQYEDKGIFDATHLRWFSARTYREMFESCGFVVDAVGPAFPLGIKGRVFTALSLHKLEHLFYKQIRLEAHYD